MKPSLLQFETTNAGGNTLITPSMSIFTPEERCVPQDYDDNCSVRSGVEGTSAFSAPPFLSFRQATSVVANPRPISSPETDKLLLLSVAEQQFLSKSRRYSRGGIVVEKNSQVLY